MEDARERQREAMSDADPEPGRAPVERTRRGRGATWVTLVSLALLAFVGVCVARALLVEPRELFVPPAEAIELEPLSLSRRLAGALRIPTIASATPDALELARFDEMRAYLAEVFPRTHQVLEVERPSDASLLFTWRGREEALAPALLLAHLDVVPVDRATLDTWPAPPFEGQLVNGYLVGRGALDDKGAAMALLEAVEHQLRRGFVPRRTVLIALGCDEELGGERGAQAVAALLEERGVAPEFILDEGMYVLEGFLEGLARPVAAIGVAEKGVLELELSASSAGGHASMPGAHTAVGRVARAVARLEERPLPAKLDAPTAEFLGRLLPDFPFMQRLALANVWLTAPLVVRKLARSEATDALLRTTTAVTLIEGGETANVLPARAVALAHFRVHPRDSIESVLAHARAAIDDDQIEIAQRGGSAPSAISPAAGPAWEVIERTARQVFPQARVAPALCIGATDARHYARLSPNVYRFRPLRLTPGEAARIHGTGERIALASYLEMIRFYVQLLMNV